MIDFILSHKFEILEIVICLVILFVNIFKKRVKVFDTIYTDILSLLPGFIKLVERDGSGDQKLASVIALVNSYLKEKYPDFKIGSYDSFIIESVESILDTPQKKPIKEDSKNER